MQQITNAVKKDNRDKIHMLGRDFYIAQVEGLSGDLDVGEKELPSFKTKGGEVIRPTYNVIEYNYSSDTSTPGHIIRNIKELTEVFGLTGEDADGMERHLVEAAQRFQLDLVLKRNGMVVVPSLQYELMRLGWEWEKIEEEEKRNQNVAVAFKSIGVATLLGEALKVGAEIYDRIHYGDKIHQIADIVKTSQRIGMDGEPTNITVSSVNDMLDCVKSYIVIK